MLLNDSERRRSLNELSMCKNSVPILTTFKTFLLQNLSKRET